MDVLLVDDDQQVLDVHRRVLERAGYMVRAVDNGLAAFAELQSQQFHAILCDLQMPFLEGQSFYDELTRAYPDMARRVVFVTAFGKDEKVRELLARTGRPVLHKPVEFDDLVTAVRRLIEGPAL